MPTQTEDTRVHRLGNWREELRECATRARHGGSNTRLLTARRLTGAPPYPCCSRV